MTTAGDSKVKADFVAEAAPSALFDAVAVLVNGGGGYGIRKGWPKRNRTDAEAAALEAVAETGAVGEVGGRPIGKLMYWKELSAGRVRVEAEVYPLRVEKLRLHWKEEGAVRRVWVPAGEAAEMVKDAALAALIEGL